MYFLTFAILSCVVCSAQALGLGELRVLSGLGQPLRATVLLLGAGADDVNHSCIRAKVATTESVFLTQVAIVISQKGQDKIITMSTGMSLNEPAIKISVDVICEAQLHRDFLVLLDPPEFLPAILKHSGRGDAGESATVDAEYHVKMPDALPATRKNTQREMRSIGKKATNGEQKFSQENAIKVERKARVSGREKITRDVLKLSDETALLNHGLKISDTLSAPLEQRISENMQELRAAQRYMAAILRDENPAQLATVEQAGEPRKIQKLLDDVEQLKNQSRIDKVHLEDIQKNSYSKGWIVGLSSLVLIGFLTILGLLVYLRRLNASEDRSWWELGTEKEEAERRKSIEEMVDSVQASYDSIELVPELIEQEDASASVETLSVVGERTAEMVSDTNQMVQTSFTRIHKPTLEEFNNSTFNFSFSRNSAVKVEEISDITQEAEFWMSVNDPQRAIEILDVQANIEHPDSPVPWLYLLDLYRLVGDKEKYDKLRRRFVEFFNANVPEFESDPQDQNALHLEDITHLIERICEFWNGAEIISFLERLLIDDRDGIRIGFELPVYRDILLLISIAHELQRMKITDEAIAGELDTLAVSVGPRDHYGDKKKQVELGAIAFDVIDFPRVAPSNK